MKWFIEMGIENLDKVYNVEELVFGEIVLFVVCGIIFGILMEGVCFFFYGVCI